MENQDMVKALKEELHKRQVKFKYTNKDGTEREATGTLNSFIYGKENEPSGSGRPVPENQVRYFDIDAQGWRSFLAENLIS
jgi:hypothetical protein